MEPEKYAIWDQYIVIIFMKSIFYLYHVHIQEKIIMKVEWTEKI